MDLMDMNAQFKENGFCIFPETLPASDLMRARVALDRGAEAARAMGIAYLKGLDPNAANIRVSNLPAIDPVFIDLLMRSDALAAVEAMLGPHFLISNFSANIALPGSKSMRLHSDQSLVIPPPWSQAVAMNIIWCLDDVHADNGATLYLPGSHNFQSPDEVPADALSKMRPFEAPAGSFIAMDGRLWHTSGSNVTAGEQRRMLFAYYSADYIRQEINWALALPSEVQASMDKRTRALFALSALGHTRIAVELTALTPPG
jgi:fumagillin biosynthesis dioxygenase